MQNYLKIKAILLGIMIGAIVGPFTLMLLLIAVYISTKAMGKKEGMVLVIGLCGASILGGLYFAFKIYSFFFKLLSKKCEQKAKADEIGGIICVLSVLLFTILSGILLALFGGNIFHSLSL